MIAIGLSIVRLSNSSLTEFLYACQLKCSDIDTSAECGLACSSLLTSLVDVIDMGVNEEQFPRDKPSGGLLSSYLSSSVFIFTDFIIQCRRVGVDGGLRSR